MSSALELWQTEWCPASHRVRQRLAELGLTYTTRQVPVEASDRSELEEATGQTTIPVLITADGQIVCDEHAILSYLDNHYPEPPDATTQRQKAAKAKQKELEKSMSQIHSSYTLSSTTELPFADAVARVREELTAEGFGVLCEIDVQATLKQKLGVDREPYLILGACNPQLAHAALEAEPELGVLLPCNVVVYQQHEQTHIAAVDAERMLSIVGNDELTATAAEVRGRLARVVERAGQG